jgi:hypothetical protein
MWNLAWFWWNFRSRISRTRCVMQTIHRQATFRHALLKMKVLHRRLGCQTPDQLKSYFIKISLGRNNVTTVMYLLLSETISFSETFQFLIPASVKMTLFVELTIFIAKHTKLCQHLFWLCSPLRAADIWPPLWVEFINSTIFSRPCF